MEAILYCFFEKVFSERDRGCLMARHKRRETVHYFSTLIEGCSRGEGCDPQTACGRAVRAATDFHEAAKRDNGGVCVLGKYHNIMYVAVKLCYDWRLEDNDTVCRLLQDLFACEKTFERLMGGAIFGTRATRLISGWKSDFADRRECVDAVRYFLDHAARGRLMFDAEGERRPMAAVPMESYGGAEPAAVCVLAGRADALALLIEYGAGPLADPRRCPLQLLLRRLQRHAETRPELPLPRELVECLAAYARVLPRVPGVLRDPETDEAPVTVHPAVLAVVPDDRTGLRPADLRHLCRCEIRHRLARNGRLPYGTRLLGIPRSLQAYIDFRDDLAEDIL